jgi:type I restriction enzyme S subunit
MEKWPIKKLGELCKINGGDAAPQDKTVFINGTIPFVRMQDLGRYHVTTNLIETVDKITNEAVQRFRLKIWPKGSILLPRSGSVYMNHRAILGIDACVVSHIAILSNFSNEILNKYLFYYLIILDIGRLGTQTTGIDSISFNQIGRLKIPVPPLPIQQKIVERLDAIRKAQELNDKQIELAEELFQSLLHRELDPKGKNWEVKYLREICKIKGGKRVPKGEHLLDIKTDHPYIRVIDFKDFSVDLSNLKYINQKIFEKIKDYIVREDDIYISIAGTTGLVGIIPKILDGANLTENAAKLIIERKNEIDKWYLVYFLFSNYGQNQIRISTYAPGVPKLALYRIEKIKIPLPPLETQRKIVEKLSAVQEYKKKLLERKQKLQELFESVLDKSFKGELAE